MFGWGYAISCCISSFRREQEERTIKIYIGECLRIMTENTAKMGGGSYMTAKLDDILNPKPIETRTSEEIIDKMKNKMQKINS